MKPWKLALGAGAACAACCAAPLVGAVTAWGLAASGLLASGAAALAAQGATWLSAGIVLLATGAGILAWRRRRASQAADARCAAGESGPACSLPRD